MNIKKYGFKDSLVKSKTNEIPARIITTYRDRYEIICDKGKGFAKLKTGSYYNNPNSIYPTIGDFVLIDWNDNGDSRIIETLKRESSFSRVDPSSDRQHEQLIAANFDYVFIMQSLNSNYNLQRIERYLTLSWQSGAIPVIILTKCDLVENYEKYLLEVESIAIGVNVYAISCKTGYGIENLKRYFKQGNTLVFLGSSGVGKSTLVNTLIGTKIMQTSEIREDDSRGRHTTTNRQLIMLPNGTMIIDTPGMRELGMWDVSEGLDKTFQDVEKHLGKCKFSDCSHINELGCRILEAIEQGELSRDRFSSYMKLRNEAKYNNDSENYLKEKNKKFKEISKYNKNNKTNKN
ncbi:MAG: ribosome small subunit-dependent GTPase A [Clostridia bacterium]|nr:ribosome small subunit-dependent GTPase A [Clostridia bacterium]MDD4387323.1 ribosome small subunit-dependent GTPase A [Clostridia bacterium]